jgi:peptidoglycan hydrolase-like protein with peptidoglycan-binding domain
VKVPLMSHPYLLSASALAALSMLSVGALLYTGAGQGGESVEAVQVPVGVDPSPAGPSARYRSQMTRAQETLRNFGYKPGPIDGIMRFETASALRAFQRERGLSVTGQANPETLAALGIEDKLFRRQR